MFRDKTIEIKVKPVFPPIPEIESKLFAKPPLPPMPYARGKIDDADFDMFMNEIEYVLSKF